MTKEIQMTKSQINCSADIVPPKHRHRLSDFVIGISFVIRHWSLVIPAVISLAMATLISAAPPPPDANPADHLPSHIRQVTWFGERADWSHDGKKLLFLSKTFGDALELDLKTKTIRNLTAHYP